MLIYKMRSLILFSGWAEPLHWLRPETNYKNPKCQEMIPSEIKWNIKNKFILFLSLPKASSVASFAVPWPIPTTTVLGLWFSIHCRYTCPPLRPSSSTVVSLVLVVFVREAVYNCSSWFNIYVLPFSLGFQCWHMNWYMNYDYCSLHRIQTVNSRYFIFLRSQCTRKLRKTLVSRGLIDLIMRESSLSFSIC